MLGAQLHFVHRLFHNNCTFMLTGCRVLSRDSLQEAGAAALTQTRGEAAAGPARQADIGHCRPGHDRQPRRSSSGNAAGGLCAGIALDVRLREDAQCEATLSLRAEWIVP